MRCRLRALLILAFPLIAALDCQAQELDIPARDSQDSAEQPQVEVPRRGISMAAVEEEFGSPDRRSEPVGDPPITVWYYDSYRVYFEGNLVLHTVRDRDTRE